MPQPPQPLHPYLKVNPYAMPAPYHAHNPYHGPPFPPYSFHPGPGNFPGPGPGFESGTYDSRDSRESSEVTGNNTEHVRSTLLPFKTVHSTVATLVES